MLAFGVTPIFLLRDIGSGMIFTILGTVLATEPALLNRLCFVGYLCSAFYIIGAYSARYVHASLMARIRCFWPKLCAPRPIIDVFGHGV